MTSLIFGNRDLQLKTYIHISINITNTIYPWLSSSSRRGLPLTRYSLEEVFSSNKKLVSFKSRKVTKTKFFVSLNNLAVLDDEETVLGVLSDCNSYHSLIIRHHYN